MFFGPRVTCCVLALGLVFGISDVTQVRCEAGTIRDDRDDRSYTGLAEQQNFAASGHLVIRIGNAPAGFASGTLIDPQWVLTAGHCVVDENGATGSSWSFQIGGQLVTVPPENVYVVSQYLTSGFESGYDLALLRLPTPIRGVKPAALAAASTELGKVITTVAYGSTGNGLTGNSQPSGTRRAGQNMIDAFAAVITVPGYQVEPIALGDERTLLSDFDNAQRTRSTLGSSLPLNLEYSAAPGDSGGGAFIMAGSGARIIGVVSAGVRPNGLRQGSYGTTAVYTRVSRHLGWIRGVMAGKDMPLPTLLAQVDQGTLQTAAELSRQRTAILARRGFSVGNFVAPCWTGPASETWVVLAAGDFFPLSATRAPLWFGISRTSSATP